MQNININSNASGEQNDGTPAPVSADPAPVNPHWTNHRGVVITGEFDSEEHTPVGVNFSGVCFEDAPYGVFDRLADGRASIWSSRVLEDLRNGIESGTYFGEAWRFVEQEPEQQFPGLVAALRSAAGEVTEAWGAYKSSGLLPYAFARVDKAIRALDCANEGAPEPSEHPLQVTLDQEAVLFADLRKAAELVISRWESGDLAAAVRALDAKLEALANA